ncbi:MAG: hypothetical protein ACRD12_22360 [Acidimicrobiales bacterium]
MPEPVDATYVNRVLQGLDAQSGDVYRLYLRDRQITSEIRDRVQAMYGTGPAFELTIRAIEAARNDRATVEPGNRITTVTRMISATSACIYVQVARDYRPVGGTDSAAVEWVGLQPISVFTNATSYNPTHWRYVVDGALPGDSQPPNPCATS